jgi:twinkle protein
VIIPHSQIHAKARELYESGGLKPGQRTGWPSVDKLYTVAMHQWTIITGTPSSGKSEWLDALMVNLAKGEEWRFFIFSPENQPLALHHSKIIEKYTGKPFNPGPTPRLDLDEFEEAENWMADKFFFCKPEHPDMESILVEGINSICHPGAGFKAGIIIDPWNFLEHHRPQWMSETEYVSDCLSRVIEHVRGNPVHLWLVAHPAKQSPNKNGVYAIPTPRDISGSAHFWNKADNCITVWRDQTAQHSSEVEIHLQKVRWKHIGHQGIAKLDYDLVTGRYREQLGMANWYENRV